MTTLVRRAQFFAETVHAGQIDKCGQPYIDHVACVARGCEGSETAECAAWLHDVLEDTQTTAEDVLAAGIPAYVVTVVQALTKPRGEPYLDYLRRIVEAGPDAIAVKIADLQDNLDPLRSTASWTMPTYQRWKYEAALRLLIAVDNARTRV